VPPVGLPLDGRERDLSLDYLILLLPGALELLLLGRLVGDEEGEDPVVVGGRLFLEVREVGGDVEDIFEELPAAVVERFIGYFAVVFELDLPRAISGLLAVGGDVEGVLLLALAVAAEAQVLVMRYCLRIDFTTELYLFLMECSDRVPLSSRESSAHRQPNCTTSEKSSMSSSMLHPPFFTLGFA
jgi:hypothetical protein